MNSKFAYLLLVIGVIFTTLISYGYIYEETNSQQKDFEMETNDIVKLIENRLSHHEQVLIGIKGLFVSSHEVEYYEWLEFVKTQNVKERFPGIQGLGYIKYIGSEADFTELENRLQKYGISNFSIHPEGVREEYYPVVFLDPIDLRNERALGYDIYTEEIRKSAVDLAKNSGKTTITGKITLVQEIEELGDVQNGFLMLTPVYDEQSSDPKRLDGFVYAVFRMDDFIMGIIDESLFERLSLKIYDGEIFEDTLFFSSYEINKSLHNSNQFSYSDVSNFGNRNWSFVFEGIPLTTFEYSLNVLIPIVGYSLSGLSFYMINILVKNLSLKRKEIISQAEIKHRDQIIETQNQSLIKFVDHESSVCVCIIDIVNSTKITSKLSDSQTSMYYGKFLNFVSKIIISYEGIVVKNIGDAILFYFEPSNHFKKIEFNRVIDCCMEIINQRDELNQQLTKLDLPKIDFRISATYGSVMIAKVTNTGLPDIFGSTVSRTSKINRLSATNGLVISDILYEKVRSSNKYKFEEVNKEIPFEYAYTVFSVKKG